MNKTEFIKAVAEQSGLSKKDAAAVINAALETITNTIKEDTVSLSGFGHMLMICAAKPIPELCGSGSLCDRFPRQFPHAIISEKNISQR